MRGMVNVTLDRLSSPVGGEMTTDLRWTRREPRDVAEAYNAFCREADRRYGHCPTSWREFMQRCVRQYDIWRGTPAGTVDQIVAGVESTLDPAGPLTKPRRNRARVLSSPFDDAIEKAHLESMERRVYPATVYYGGGRGGGKSLIKTAEASDIITVTDLGVVAILGIDEASEFLESQAVADLGEGRDVEE